MGEVTQFLWCIVSVNCPASLIKLFVLSAVFELFVHFTCLSHSWYWDQCVQVSTDPKQVDAVVMQICFFLNACQFFHSQKTIP
jgi:hypothetical protein